MPQLANIAVNDGAATPVSHTFAPVTTDGSTAKLAERVGVPAAFPTLEVGVRPPVSGNGLYKVRFLMKIPTTKVVDGRTVVDFVQYGDVTLVMSERGDEASRKNLRVLIANLLLNATATSVVEKLEPLY